jgi:hypothetical protein
MVRLLAVTLVLLVAACGGGGSGDGGGAPNPGGGTTDPGGGTTDPGGGTGGDTNPPGGGTSPLAVTSTLTPLTPQSLLGAVATNVACTRNGVGAYYSAIRIVATSWVATCEGFRDNKANSTTLDVLVRRTSNGPSPVPIAPGQYQVGASGDTAAVIRVAKKDVWCGPGTNVNNWGMGTAGTVTVTSVSPRLEGSVDATLSNGARVTGVFSTAICTTGAGDACDVATLDLTSTGVCIP